MFVVTSGVLRFNGLRRLFAALVLGLVVFSITACSSPEEKVARFYERGAAFLADSDLVKARIEFQNALQINPDMVPALMGLAEIAERNQEWQRVFTLLSRVVELDPKNVQAQVRLGKLLLAAGEFEPALAASEAALSEQPKGADVLALRAAVMLKLDDMPGAVRLANEALAVEPRHTDALVVLASERLLAGDAAGAIPFLDRGLEGNERDVALQLIKVQALERMSNAAEAEAIFKRLIEFYPENRAFRTILAQFYVMNSQMDLAEAEFRGMVQAFPTDVQAKFDVVRFLNTVRSPEAGMAQLNQYVSAEPANHDLRFFQAAMFNAAGDREGAATAYRSIISSAGDKDGEAINRARAALANDALARGDKPAAVALVGEIISSDARNEAGLLLRAGIALDEQRLDDAVADLRTVLRDTPSSARAHALLGKAHELQGAADLALDHYGRGHQAGRSQSPQFGMVYAEYLLKTGRDRQVEGVMRDVLTNFPNHVPALRLLAQSFINVGDLAGAQAVADQVAKLDGEGVSANQIQGAVFAARQNFESAISSLRRAYDVAPAEVQPMVALIRGYLAAGRQREALGFMQSVVNASPNNVEARMLQAQLYQQAGDRVAARAAYEAALGIDSGLVPAYLGLMSLAAAENRFADADTWLSKGLQATGNDYSLRLARASVLERLAQFDEAIALYEGLLVDRPGAEVVINNLASLLSDYRTDKASHERAFQLAQRFRNSTVPQFRDTLGWAAYRVGRIEEAVILLKSAMDELPNLAVVHYHYGKAQVGANNNLLAREALERAVALGSEQPFPQLEDARATLASL